MLRIDRLSVRYGSVAALRDVSVEVREGETVALVGVNGAGKSTLLNTVAGLVRPQDGRIELRDASLVGLPPERVLRRGLALVPEGRRMLGTLTVYENLLVATSSRRDRRGAARDVDDALQRFEILGRYRDTPSARLSGGEQQQLAIARALLARPAILLLDEPSLGLAPKMIDRVFDVLAELRREGVTLLLVEQFARRALAFADRTYVMRSGRVVAHGPERELASDGRLLELYLGGGL